MNAYDDRWLLCKITCTRTEDSDWLEEMDYNRNLFFFKFGDILAGYVIVFLNIQSK